MKKVNPRQAVLFPELGSEDYSDSIRSMPDFDKALENFIKLSDFGAFVQYTISGIEKSFTLNTAELTIPENYLHSDPEPATRVFHLFPADVRKNLQRIRYEARNFFNKENSIRTIFGPFLFRSCFHRWYQHREAMVGHFRQFLYSEIGESGYNQYVLSLWNDGLSHIIRQLHARNPYLTELSDRDDLVSFIDEQTRESAIPPDADHPEFLLFTLAQKTRHIPLSLAEYTAGVAIQSSFKSMYLDDLKNARINDIDDVRLFLAGFTGEEL